MEDVFTHCRRLATIAAESDVAVDQLNLDRAVSNLPIISTMEDYIRTIEPRGQSSAGPVHLHWLADARSSAVVEMRNILAEALQAFIETEA